MILLRTCCFSHALFFPMILALFFLLTKLVVLRLVFSTKKKGQNHGKKQGMWKNNKFVEESLTMIYLDYSRWLNVGRWWEFWSKCLQWWHVKIRWWVLEILRNWCLRNIDLFPYWVWINWFMNYVSTQPHWPIITYIDWHIY